MHTYKCPYAFSIIWAERVLRVLETKLFEVLTSSINLEVNEFHTLKSRYNSKALFGLTS